MYKIEIKYDFRSPSMRVLTGTVQIGNVDFGMLDSNDSKPFPFKKERNTLGYSNCPSIFSRCKPLVDVMVRSHFHGMIYEDLTVEWFRECNRVNNDVNITMMD